VTKHDDEAAYPSAREMNRKFGVTLTTNPAPDGERDDMAYPSAREMNRKLGVTLTVNPAPSQHPPLARGSLQRPTRSSSLPIVTGAPSRAPATDSMIAILNPDGVAIDEVATPAEAYERARALSATGTVIADGNVWAEPEYVTNPPPPGRVGLALAAAGVQPVPIDWERMAWGSDNYERELENARAKLLFHGEDLYREIIEASYGTAHGTVGVGQIDDNSTFKKNWLTSQLLRENQKMAKILAGSDRQYDARGLSLLPHGSSFRDPFSRSTDNEPKSPHGFTNCLHSTSECRMACLVNTGQRALGSGAFAASYLYSRMLREHAPEFLMLVHNECIKSFLQAQRGGFSRFLRLNVMSDIPWELFAPGMIENATQVARKQILGNRRWTRRDGIMFYDYTKVAGRTPSPDHYDLTYSFSGMQSSIDEMIAGWEHGRRSAVVFVFRENELVKGTAGAGYRETYYRGDPGAKLKKIESTHLPFKFFGHEVFNGDKSDIRPLDPKGTKVVGLAYKVSRYKVQTNALRKDGTPKAYDLKNYVFSHELDEKMPHFLVRVHKKDGKLIVAGTQDLENRVLRQFEDQGGPLERQRL
jgi:hypothetical protein